MNAMKIGTATALLIAVVAFGAPTVAAEDSLVGCGQDYVIGSQQPVPFAECQGRVVTECLLNDEVDQKETCIDQ